MLIKCQRFVAAKPGVNTWLRMIRIAIIAPLLLATGMVANAEICIAPTDDVVQARTAKCLLVIDGMLLVDERCNFRVSPDGRRAALDAGEDHAEVNVSPRGAAIASWNRGSGRRDHLTSLGLVTRAVTIRRRPRTKRIADPSP
jgi:hypothetical protein